MLLTNAACQLSTGWNQFLLVVSSVQDIAQHCRTQLSCPFVSIVAFPKKTGFTFSTAMEVVQISFGTRTWPSQAVDLDPEIMSTILLSLHHWDNPTTVHRILFQPQVKEAALHQSATNFLFDRISCKWQEAQSWYYCTTGSKSLSDSQLLPGHLGTPWLLLSPVHYKSLLVQGKSMLSVDSHFSCTWNQDWELWLTANLQNNY